MRADPAHPPIGIASLANARIEHAWGGPIDVSADHLPFFGTVGGSGSTTASAPLQRLGGGLVRSAIIRTEEAEDEGRRPGVATQAVAALPRLLRMQVGTR